VVDVADSLGSTAALIQMLTEHGPLPEGDIWQRLRAIGEPDPEYTFAEFLGEIGDAAGLLSDGRWAWLPTLLAGRIFTHRLGADELAHDILTVTPDLDPVTSLCANKEFGRFSDGSSVVIAVPMFDRELLDELNIPLDVVDASGALVLPPGTLAALNVGPGALVGLRLTAQGLSVEQVGATVDADLGAGLAALLTDDQPIDVSAAVWSACVDDPTLFLEALEPLGEIVDDAGLACDGEWLAPAGFDFPAWRVTQASGALAERYGLDPDEASAVRTLLQLHEQMVDAIEDIAEDDAAGEEAEMSALPILDEFTAELGSVLADPAAAEAFLAEALIAGRSGAAALGLFAETLEPHVTRPARVAFRWLQAIALERTDLVAEAEQALLAAESMDTDWAPALYDLARFAADRGDAERALSLLRRAGCGPDDPMVRLVQQYLAAPRSDVGRNDVCWCGSGRKYKKCHLGREQLALQDRAGWLYIKAVQHTLQSVWRDLVSDVEDVRTYYADSDAESTDAVVLDSVLFEGGAFAEFLALRGFLLPDDERELAGQWLRTTRSVFEVETVSRRGGLTVRDVRTEKSHQVQEPAEAPAVKIGQLACARLLPAGSATYCFGGLEPVAVDERDALLALLDSEPDPVDLVAALSRRFAGAALS
jgi:tetratricopeptide (TPR) repeat protein